MNTSVLNFPFEKRVKVLAAPVAYASELAGWVMKKEDVLSEFSSDGRYPLNRKLSGVFYFLLKWVAPIAVTLIFITNFLS